MKRQSVIEEWQNPSSERNYVIKGDQLYEERAVDVVNATNNPPPDLIQRRDNGIRSTTENERETMIKIKKPQGGGTVRNIPIKDYQASIAANFGTIRRSAQAQQQFESLVSEPERGLRLTGTGAGVTKQRGSLIPRVHKSNLKVTQSSGIPASDELDTPESPIRGPKTKDAVEKESDLRRGHVVQKISVYEENSREPGRKSLEICRSRRQLGVPLVGMHNACGLPVILDPIHASKRVVASMRPISKIPLVVPTGIRSRTQPKRKAPQRPSRMEQEFRSNERRFTIESRRGSASRDSSAPESTIDSWRKVKNQRRPSLKVSRINATLPLRNYRDSSLDKANRMTFRTVKGEAKRKSPLLESFRRRSLKRGSAKRKTLYAKAEGNDAAKILSNLCINPLARSKEAANMIW